MAASCSRFLFVDFGRIIETNANGATSHYPVSDAIPWNRIAGFGLLQLPRHTERNIPVCLAASWARICSSFLGAKVAITLHD